MAKTSFKNPFTLLTVFFGVAALKPARPSQPRNFPLSIVALAPEDALTAAKAARLVAILNERFRDQDGVPIFHFHLHRFTRADDAMPCAELRALGNQEAKPARAAVQAAFDACRDPRLADRTTIPLYLFRSAWDDGSARKSSYAYNWIAQPFVFINIDRLDDDWSVLEHEIANAFAVPEAPACGSTPETPTDPMGHEMDFCSGTGGDRSLGFSAWQVAIMRTTAPFVAANLEGNGMTSP